MAKKRPYNLRLGTTLIKRVQAEARRQETTASELIRTALELYLNGKPHANETEGECVVTPAGLEKS